MQPALDKFPVIVRQFHADQLSLLHKRHAATVQTLGLAIHQLATVKQQYESRTAHAIPVGYATYQATYAHRYAQFLTQFAFKRLFG